MRRNIAQVNASMWKRYVHRKNDFAEGSKILLDTDQIILSDHQNNFVGILKIMSNAAAKNFDILV